ncbi:ATP-dependent helicase HrpB [Cyanobium sp. Morenito 9A2]|uniref:ATP-dependent helicase HrpB n=1 Tax=Cyanobium sp. Morenito 9A2 TaxID=2823718 RepID=UPI0020CC5F89|nr:ATP-dependent helicase HrpB [Cyanobium sp. Morenito 9A2]MCP9849877.1 ATP-dependent helicase HrpB [Cyanobium sp. Morenito 9A2]
MSPLGPDEALPIDPLLARIVSALSPGGTLLLQAPPGAGKTTRVPLALLEHLERSSDQDGKAETILMLEPRRLAARAAAERLAANLGETVGERVGYRVRLEQRVSASTRLEVLTDGLFLRRLQADPALEGVACVLFDEFHERRAEADLALALLREARSVLAPHLRLGVMSATLNLQPLAAQLPEAVVITSQGRSFPVTVGHQTPREREPLARQVVRALEEHWLDGRRADDTVLVFVPGQKEIRQCQEVLAVCPWAAGVVIAPLHGHQPLEAQRRAIAPERGTGGKVVLATAIAESSLTIEGVTLVIDSGLSRRSRFSPRTGMDGLVTVPASGASAEQRAGRAGRLAPGRCVRLWSPAEQQRRPAFDPPELQECDPAPLVLQLAQWGAGLGTDLPWLEPPPLASLLEGQALLRQLGALEAGGALSAHGRALARLGLHPRLGHLLLRAAGLGFPELGCALAVLLSERDPLDSREHGCDLMRRLDWLRQNDRDSRRQPLLALQRQWRRQLDETVHKPAAYRPNSAEAGTCTETEAEIAAELVAWAYPERVAIARGATSNRYLLCSGQGALLHPTDPLVGGEALAVAALEAASASGGANGLRAGASPEARILAALPLPKSVLLRLQNTAGEEVRSLHWDAAEGRVRALIEQRLGALRLGSRPWSDPPEPAVTACLLEALKRDGLQLLPWTAARRQLQHRLVLAHQHLGPPWTDRSDTALAADLGSWLGEHLTGMRSLADLAAIELGEALWSGLPWALRAELDQLFPEQVAIPTGRLARLEYSSGEPVLAVKLQELFGLREGPKVLGGQLPVSMQLLSPAGRPVQITRDLAGFWRGSYAQVRQELRGRYPKHPWPEDPLTATPTAFTNRRAASSPPGAGGRSRSG